MFYLDMVRETPLSFGDAQFARSEVAKAIQALLGFQVPRMRHRIALELVYSPGWYLEACEIFGLEGDLRDTERCKEEE